jgi:hypothetical protein
MQLSIRLPIFGLYFWGLIHWCIFVTHGDIFRLIDKGVIILKKRLITFGILLFATISILSGCNSTENKPKNNSNTVLESKQEIKDGDFVYRLFTEKEQYEEDGPVKITAELEYVGEKEQIEIFHAASPFSFPMFEKTRNYHIDYPMNEPLLSTTIVKGTPLRKEYTGGAGGYSMEDDKKFVNFMKKIMDKKFPTGEYEVNGVASFFVKTDTVDNQKSYNLKAEIGFRVE